jgi:methionyl-tRNA formyltransferase
LNIVFFVKKGPSSAEFLKQIKENGITINYIFIEKSKPKTYFKRLKISINRYGFINFLKILMKKIIFKILPKNAQNWQRNDFYYKFSERIFFVNDFNNIKCNQLLIKIKPDLIILGATDVIHRNIIKIPKFGIINSHPGLLPKYRGVDVIPWAIMNEDEVGVTVHFIDEGIDTGDIIYRKKIPINKKDTLESLKEKADKLNGQLLVKVILTLSQNGKIKTELNPKERGKLYFKMDKTTLQLAREKLKQRILKNHN